MNIPTHTIPVCRLCGAEDLYGGEDFQCPEHGVHMGTVMVKTSECPMCDGTMRGDNENGWLCQDCGAEALNETEWTLLVDARDIEKRFGFTVSTLTRPKAIPYLVDGVIARGAGASMMSQFICISLWFRTPTPRSRDGSALLAVARDETGW